MATVTRVGAFIALICLVEVLTGCTESNGPKVDLQEGPQAVGKRVFAANCVGCHDLGGESAEGRAPNLGKIGAKPEHTVEWIMELIRNPKSKNPKARMRAFGDSIKEDDLRALAEFLVSLK